MLNSTTNTYTLKREILTFSNKISKYLTKPDRKFTADMTYGMLAAVFSQMWQTSFMNYLSLIHKWVPDKPIIHIDDSDIVKPALVRSNAVKLFSPVWV